MAKRINSTEIDKRVDLVHSLIVACYPHDKIVSHVINRYNVREKEALEYIQRARDKIIYVSALERQQAIAEEIELRREIIQKALAEKKLSTALQAADSRAKLRGLFDTLDKALDTVLRHGFIVTDPSDQVSEDKGEFAPVQLTFDKLLGEDTQGNSIPSTSSGLH